MKRLYILAEGQTEEEFVNKVLAPHFVESLILHPVTLVTRRDANAGRIYRGGVSKYSMIHKEIIPILHDCRHHAVWLTTMLDLYRLPSDFPGRDTQPTDPYQRVKHLEESFADKWVDHPQSHCFIPHIQLHEFETLLLSDVGKFRTQAEFSKHKDWLQRIDQMEAEIVAFENVELINESSENAPSKRIMRYLPDYDKNKVRVGPKIAEQIGLSKMRERCPHFSEWITQLERLNQA